jgi:D-aminoacyl-tRNA deacylase
MTFGPCLIVIMRALLQRVSEASVKVEGFTVGSISIGLLIFLGIQRNDTSAEAEQLARKIVQLRIFPDAQGKMNLSLADTGGELLVVPQFTLYADTRKGNRPSYTEAAKPEAAEPLYEYFVGICRAKGFRVSTGIFRAHMQVALVNDGPVTILCYSAA